MIALRPAVKHTLDSQKRREPLKETLMASNDWAGIGLPVVGHEDEVAFSVHEVRRVAHFNVDVAHPSPRIGDTNHRQAFLHGSCGTVNDLNVFEREVSEGHCALIVQATALPADSTDKDQISSLRDFCKGGLKCSGRSCVNAQDKNEEQERQGLRPQTALNCLLEGCVAPARS